MTLWIVLFGVGCGVNQDNFGDQYVNATCDFTERCLAYTFYDQWDDKSECVDDLLDDYDAYKDDVIDELDCEFDQEKAESCLSALNATCKDAADDNDLLEDCNRSWDCGDGPGPGPGLD